ncbi:MAG: AEC family transporter [Rhizobacter sp.]|nr:AEC family transporter [Burkholderiales bacterium]
MLSTVSVILPATIIVIAGFVAGRRVLDPSGIKTLSDLCFLLFLPCLLFRSMATARFEGSDLTLLAAYFGASLLWFLCVALFSRRNSLQTTAGAIVMGLGAVFSNTVQLGIPIQKLAFGDAGLTLHLSIIALHSLVLLTAATVWLEVSRARESTNHHSLGRNIFNVVKTSVLHPVILPILAGLLWGFAGFPLPEWVDQPLGFLASAAGPLMLVLMGAQLSTMRLSEHLRGAFALTVAKNLVHPLLIFGVAWALGLSPLATAVAVTCAALPIGSNVFLFAQRYNANENITTAATAMSSLAALVSLTITLALLPKP